MAFRELKRALQFHFESMVDHPLYRTDVEKDLLWETYLGSFPEGSNPMMRERTEHDCQACKSFVRAVGSVVALINGELVSLWDCEVEYPYNRVAAVMSELVKAAPIRNVLLHDQQQVGVAKNYQTLMDGSVLTWEHFSLTLPLNCVRTDRDAVYGQKAADRQVFQRALEEINPDAVRTVIELIDQDSLYRGAEHLSTLQTLLAHQRSYRLLENERSREFYTWRQDVPPSVSHIRSSAIGTLLVDISGDMDLDEAVRRFETKVAPANYQRPKAVVTKAMIERARKTVEELGYGAALDRRFARPEDITVDNVLFANRDARAAMGADVFDELAGKIREDTKDLDRVEKVPIEKFTKDVLPRASSLELLVENRHGGNLVNLVAPVDPNAPSILKWTNNFTWVYRGDLADSIKERVKARGGSVTGDFRASLAWFNSDDLDLHLVEPGGFRIYFGGRQSPCGGELDVDMNISASGPNSSRNAVENITYPDRRRMAPGEYRLEVNNYTHREAIDVGFEVEVEFDGSVSTFDCEREVRPGETVMVARFTYDHERGITFLKTLPHRDASKTIWSLQTQHFHPVTMVMLSPNHWGDRSVGNKHYLFMLQGCRREGSSRGFFNEQLSDELREHRKVFELLGAKMRTEEEGEQLSGLGFSSTQRNNIYCRVRGAFSRIINITF